MAKATLKYDFPAVYAGWLVMIDTLSYRDIESNPEFDNNSPGHVNSFSIVNYPIIKLHPSSLPLSSSSFPPLPSFLNSNYSGTTYLLNPHYIITASIAIYLVWRYPAYSARMFESHMLCAGRTIMVTGAKEEVW